MDYGHTAQQSGLNPNMMPGANSMPSSQFGSSETDDFATAITPGVGVNPETTNPDLTNSLYYDPTEYMNRSDQMSLGAKTMNVNPYLPPETPTNAAGIAGITEANRVNNFSEIGQNATPELGQIVDLTPPEATAAPVAQPEINNLVATTTEDTPNKPAVSSVSGIISALEKDPGSAYEAFQEMREGTK